MIPVTALLRALCGPEEVRRERGRFRLSKAGTCALLLLVGLILPVLAFTALWSTWALWQPLAGSNAYGFAVAAFCSAWITEAAALVIVALPPRVSARARALGDALRALIARADDALTPPVALQPRRMTPVEPGRVTELRPFKTVPSGRDAIWPSVFVLTAGCAVLAACIPLILAVSDDATTDVHPIQVIGSAVIVILAGIAAGLMITTGRGAHPRLTLDDTGIRYRRWGREQAIAWGEIKAVTQIVAAPLLNRSAGSALDARVRSGSTTYYLDDGASVFAWYVASANNEREYRASEDLLGYVATRTGLPLRDATGLASDLRALSLPRAGALLVERMPADAADRLAPVLREAAAQLPPAHGASRLKIAAVALLVLALAIPNLALPVAAQRLEQAQSQFNANYYATVRASRPQYTTDFATNDGNWLDSGLVREDDSYAFVDGAYHMIGAHADNTILARYPVVLQDVAVEVTVAQREQSPPMKLTSGLSGAGVLISSTSDYTAFLVFIVNIDGHWGLWRYSLAVGKGTNSWHGLNSGYSAAINKGYGAHNTIFAIQRGHQVTVRVNGQPVLDDNFPAEYYPGLPTQGYAGLYSDQSGLDTIFTEFTLYRLPSRPSFWSALGVRWALPGSRGGGG